MGILNVRNLPDDVHQELRLRAARAGRSMEAEARLILTQACRPERPAADSIGLQEFVLEFYGSRKPDNAVEEFLEERRREAQQE